MRLRACCDEPLPIKKKGYGSMKLKVDEEALDHLTAVSNGDVRRALNALELGILTKEKDDQGYIHIDLETAQECIQKKAVQYDKRAITIMTPFRPLSKVYEAQILTRLFTGWPRCWKPGKILNSSQGGL